MATGTTATVCLVRQERGERVLYTANVGDSKAYLISSFGVRQITYEHKGTDPREQQRIQEMGGICIAGRVSGSLAVTRALGDWQMKGDGVISRPHVERYTLTVDDRLLVIASDGLWDVVQEHELGKYATIDDVRSISIELLTTALQRDTKDNIAIMVVRL
jgi:serine/threonine protein phosphatase PrpC